MNRNPVPEGGPVFQSVEEVQQRFREARYIASRRVATVVYLAARMGRPVLIEGPAGVGKTELAKTLSDVTRRTAPSGRPRTPKALRRHRASEARRGVRVALAG